MDHDFRNSTKLVWHFCDFSMIYYEFYKFPIFDKRTILRKGKGPLGLTSSPLGPRAQRQQVWAAQPAQRAANGPDGAQRPARPAAHTGRSPTEPTRPAAWRQQAGPATAQGQEARARHRFAETTLDFNEINP